MTTNYLTIPHSNVKVTFAQVAKTAVVATTALHKTSLNDRIPSRYDIKFIDIIIKEKKKEVFQANTYCCEVIYEMFHILNCGF